MPVRIGLRCPVPLSVVGVDSLRACWIGHAGQVVYSIVGIQGFIPLPVGNGSFIAVAVVFIFLHIPQRICLAHQFSRFGILIRIAVSQRTCLLHEISLCVIFIARRIPHRVCLCQDISHPVTGVGRCIAQCIRAGGKIPPAVIGICPFTIPGIYTLYQISIPIIRENDFCPIFLRHGCRLHPFIIRIILCSAVGISDALYIYRISHIGICRYASSFVSS